MRFHTPTRLGLNSLCQKSNIDNPLFMDLTNLEYVSKTILPWMLKYVTTLPRIAKLNRPVEEYLQGFSNNRALIDIVAQHFFQKTPASFALSYFSLYLDYRYPRGGTGSLPQALEQFILEKGGEIRKETGITHVDPARDQATDLNGNIYQYRKLIWAADQKALYRLIDLASLTNRKVVRNIQARQKKLSGKIGGDFIFTLYLTVNLDKEYFSRVSNPHFFYTPSLFGLSHASLDELCDHDRKADSGLYQR